ncbi:DeoR/GlpR family DNA-binding transcription regulator [Kouleothrix sp.]|uniref:DeoR/GlpR family DNA-binding transcription regulator n=1 Tax=Kouleothrix sp. TaxID=2779161 RepID=UPI00391A47FC
MKANEIFLEERRRGIAELARAEGRVTVDDLSQRYAVSGATIRADLRALAEQGLLARTHGGAVLIERASRELSFDARRHQQPDAKQRIGRAAAALVCPGEAIVLDTSSTALELARALRDQRELTILTNSLAVVDELFEAPQIAVVLLGGMLRRGSRSLVGHDGLGPLRRYTIGHGFFGAHGLAPDAGLTDVSPAEAEVKRALVGACRSVVALLDATKLGQVGAAAFAPASQVDVLVTDAPAGHPGLAPFAASMRIVSV